MTSTVTSTRLSESTSRTLFMTVSRSLALFATVALALGLIVLAGCSAGMPRNSITPVVAAPSAFHAFNGVVHGGQSPITGANIYLFAVGASGYGSASTSLLTSATGNPADSNGNYYVQTNDSGGFSITSSYTCPSSTSLIYLLSSGGNSGSGTNTNAYLLALLGNCVAVQNSAAAVFINMNEVTTVTGVYALAPYMTYSAVAGYSAINIGSPSTTAALAGITNAFAEANNVVSTSYGAAYSNTPAGNGVVPAALIYSLGNALGTCINSSGGSNCNPLFTPTTVNSIAPTDTIAAVLSIAQNPGHSVMAITAIGGYPGAPFVPYLATTPNDLTMAVQYSGYGIGEPQAVAIDAGGNAWVANATNAVTELSAATGAPLSGSSGFTTGSLNGPTSIAIDTSGKTWVTNCGSPCSGTGSASSITVMTPGGGGVSSSNLTGGALNGAYGLSLDASPRAWIANSLGTNISVFNSTGDASSGSGYSSTYQSNTTATAVDTSGNAWSVSPSTNAVTEFTSVGGAGANSYQGSGVSYPFAVAIDASNRPWIVDQGSNALTVLNAGTPISGSPFSGGGLSTPNSIVLDGNGTAWISNANGSVSAFTSSGTAVTPSTGFIPGQYQSGTVYANGVAVDGSGSLWVTVCGSYCGGTGSDAVYQVIGVATPVITPIAAGLSSTLATKP